MLLAFRARCKKRVTKRKAFGPMPFFLANVSPKCCYKLCHPPTPPSPHRLPRLDWHSPTRACRAYLLYAIDRYTYGTLTNCPLTESAPPKETTILSVPSLSRRPPSPSVIFQSGGPSSRRCRHHSPCRAPRKVTQSRPPSSSLPRLWTPC